MRRIWTVIVLVALLAAKSCAEEAVVTVPSITATPPARGAAIHDEPPAAIATQGGVAETTTIITSVALVQARSVQEKLDDASRRLHFSQLRLRSAYARETSRALSLRKKLLQRIPEFWYHAILGLPRYDAFLSMLPEDSGDFSGGGVDDASDGFVHPDRRRRATPKSSAPSAADSYPAVADDHFILRTFLTSVRCHAVRHDGTLSREALDRTVHESDGASDQDSNANGYVPRDAHLPPSEDEVSSFDDPSNQAYRIVFSFAPNPYFADPLLYKQLPLTHSHMLFAADDESQDAFAVEPRLGQGNTVSWTSRLVREAVLAGGNDHARNQKQQPPSFFELFDDEAYVSSSTRHRQLLQLRAAALVSSVCLYLEPDPFPFWDKVTTERQSHHERLRHVLGADDVTAVSEEGDAAGVLDDAHKAYESPQEGDAADDVAPPPSQENEELHAMLAEAKLRELQVEAEHAANAAEREVVGSADDDDAVDDDDDNASL